MGWFSSWNEEKWNKYFTLKTSKLITYPDKVLEQKAEKIANDKAPLYNAKESVKFHAYQNLKQKDTFKK